MGCLFSMFRRSKNINQNINDRPRPQNAIAQQTYNTSHSLGFDFTRNSTVPPVTVSNYRQPISIAMPDSDPEEIEHQRRMNEIRRNNEESLRAFNAQMSRLDEHRATKRRRQEEDDRARLEEMKRDMRMRNSLRNTGSYEETRTTPTFYSLQMERERDEFQSKLNEIQQREKWNSLNHEKEMEAKRMKFEKDEKEHQQNMEKIEKEYQNLCEQAHKNEEKRRRQMSQQNEEIRNALQRMVWNAICERNWTERLNMLRSANEDSRKIEFYCLGKNSNTSKIQDWIRILKSLKKTMDEESENMTKAYDFAGKSFLLVIKSAVINVADKCERLISELIYSSTDQEAIRRASSELNRACLNIPTLAELKRDYYREMRNNSTI